MILPNEIWVLIKSFLFVPELNVVPEMEFIRLENQKVDYNYDDYVYEYYANDSGYDDDTVVLDFSKYKNQNVLIRNLRIRDYDNHCIWISKPEEEVASYNDIFRDSTNHYWAGCNTTSIRTCLYMKFNTTPSFNRGVNPNDCTIRVESLRTITECIIVTYEVYKPKVPTRTLILKESKVSSTPPLSTDDIMGVTINIASHQKIPQWIKFKKYNNLVFMFKKRIIEPDCNCLKCYTEKDKNTFFYQKVYTLKLQNFIKEVGEKDYVLHYWSYIF